VSRRFLALWPESIDDPKTDPEIILMIVAAVVDSRQNVIHLHSAQRKVIFQLHVQAAAGREGKAVRRSGQAGGSGR